MRTYHTEFQDGNAPFQPGSTTLEYAWRMVIDYLFVPRTITAQARLQPGTHWDTVERGGHMHKRLCYRNTERERGTHLATISMSSLSHGTPKQTTWVMSFAQ